MLDIQTRMRESLRLLGQKDLGSVQDLWQGVIANVGWATRDGRGKLIHDNIDYFTPLKLFKNGLNPET